jgi:hypothetical protein
LERTIQPVTKQNNEVNQQLTLTPEDDELFGVVDGVVAFVPPQRMRKLLGNQEV